MNNLIQILNVCEEADILKVILYVKIIIQYAFYIIPIGLILMLAFDFFKNVITQNDADMKKNLNLAIKRIIYCVIMFFIPTIVSFVISIIDESISSFNIDYQSCLENTNNITYFQDMKDADSKEEENAIQQKIDAARARLNEELLMQEELKKIRINIGNNNSNNSGNDTNTNNRIGNLTLDWNDVTKISNASVSDLQKALKSYNATEFLPYAATYIKLERQNNVNAFFVIGINAHESGWLGSTVTKDCNNIAGVKYVGQPGSFKCDTTTEGDNYAGWKSIDEFLNYYIPWLKKEYLTEGGSYFEGYTPEAVSIHYVNGSTSWQNSVKNIGSSIFKELT